MIAPAGAARARGDAWEASVALGGGLALAAALQWQAADLADVTLWPAALLALGVVAAELWPLRLPGGERRISVSAAPALALALCGPVLLAMLALALPALVDDLRRRVPLRGLFAAGQCVLALAAARGVFSLGTGTGFLDPATDVGTGELPRALPAGLAFLAVTLLAPSVAVALHGRLRLRLVVTEAVRGCGPGLVLVAVAPAVAALASNAAAALPLLVPVVAAVADAARRRTDELGEDPLTGLPGRPLLAGRVADALADDPDGRVALLLVDLPDLPEVNDILGHSAGDELLLETAARIGPAMPAGAALLRRGCGFAVVVPGIDVVAATALGDRLVAQVADHSGEGLQPRAVVGVAVAPAHGRTTEELLAAAGVARHRAGRSRSPVQVFGADAPRRPQGLAGHSRPPHPHPAVRRS